MKIIAGLTILTMILLPCAALGWDSSEADAADPIDVFLLAGQSNAAYTFRAVPNEATPTCAPGVAYYYGDATQPVQYADWVNGGVFSVYDMMNTDGTAHIGGVELPFASTYYEKTGHKICVINVAIGGSTIAKWTPGNTYYEWAQDVFDAALIALNEQFTPDVKGLIWIQGESDPNLEIATYKTRFMSMFNSMTHNTTGSYFNDTYAFEGCIMCLTRQNCGPNSCLAQVQLDAENDNVKLGCIVCDTFTYANGLLYNDDTHATQKGRNIMGVDLANNYVTKFLT